MRFPFPIAVCLVALAAAACSPSDGQSTPTLDDGTPVMSSTAGSAGPWETAASPSTGAGDGATSTFVEPATIAPGAPTATSVPAAARPANTIPAGITPAAPTTLAAPTDVITTAPDPANTVGPTVGCVPLSADLVQAVLTANEELTYDSATCSWVLASGESNDVRVVSDFHDYANPDDAEAGYRSRLVLPAGYVQDLVERLADEAASYHSVPATVGKEEYVLVVRCGNTVLTFGLEYPVPQPDVRPEAVGQLLALFYDTEPSRCYVD